MNALLREVSNQVGEYHYIDPKILWKGFTSTVHDESTYVLFIFESTAYIKLCILQYLSGHCYGATPLK